MNKTALEHLANWLSTYHRKYTIDDVKPTDSRGYLECTKLCNCTYPPFDGYTIGVQRGPHYHSLYIGDLHYKGFGRGSYAFWRAVCAELNARQGSNKTS